METYNYNTEDMNVLAAQKQVKRIKGFYIHALVYVCVNLVIIFGNYYENGGNIFDFDSYATAFYWGIGLLAHGLSVFNNGWFFGKDWEERKIQEYLKK